MVYAACRPRVVFVAVDRPGQSTLVALVLLLRFNGISAYVAEIPHRFGGDIGVLEVLRCAKEFELKARASNWRRLIAAPLPGIVVFLDGRSFLVVKAIEDQVLVLDPLSLQPSQCRAQKRSGSVSY